MLLEISEKEDKQTVENDYAKIRLLPQSSILECIFKCGHVELEEAKICVQTRYKASKKFGGKDFCILINMKGVASVNKEARDFFAKEESSHYIKVAALLVSSPVNKIIGNLFLEFNRPKRPAKLFNDREKAIKWLKQYQTKSE